MDKIYIKNLTAKTIIGMREHERSTAQTVRISLELATDARRAAASDALEDTLDYGEISRQVVAFVEASRCCLIETLAERLAQHLREQFAIDWLQLRVSKPAAVAAAADVGVIIERGCLTQSVEPSPHRD